MPKKRILIVAYRYPPINTMGSRRWKEMIPFLQKDYEIYVFTTKSSGDLKSPIPEENIFRSHSIENEILIKDYSPSKLHRLVSFFIHEIRFVDNTWITWYHRNKNKFLDYFDQLTPDYLITTVGPYSSALFGYLIKRKRSKCKWILDIRDPASLYHEHRKNHIQQYIDQQVDKFICSKSDLIIATLGDSSKEKIQELYNKEVFQILNGYTGNLHFSEDTQTETEHDLVLYYAGRIYEHRLPSMRLLISAVKNYNLTLKIRLLATRSDFNKIKSYLKNEKINNVELLEPADSSVIINETLTADISILIEALEVQSESDLGVLPGKLFELLNFKAPIMAICSPDSYIGKILKNTNRGKIVNTTDQIQEFIDNYKQYTLQDESKIKKYSREYQTNKFVKLLRRKFEEE